MPERFVLIMTEMVEKLLGHCVQKRPQAFGIPGRHEFAGLVFSICWCLPLPGNSRGES
jgi:hypothetical protein